MNHFIINRDDFGVDKVEWSTDNDKLSLKIYGSEERFDRLCEADSSEWLWAMYPPEIYLYDIPLKRNSAIELNDKLAQLCDFALYMMEHNDIYGKMTVIDNTVNIIGDVYIMGKIYPIDVKVDLQ